MNRFLTLALIFIVTPLFAQVPCGVTAAQTVDEPTTGYVDDPVQNIDESQLVQRVDALTETVNTHTDQIATLDERVKRLESATVAVSAPTPVSSLSTSLKPTTSVASVPSGEIRLAAPAATTSSRIVSGGQPVVTSVTMGEPIVTGVSYGPATIVPTVSTTPVVSSRNQVSTRRVRVPMTEVTTSNVRYEACPGGVCPTPATSRPRLLAPRTWRR